MDGTYGRLPNMEQDISKSIDILEIHVNENPSQRAHPDVGIVSIRRMIPPRDCDIPFRLLQI